jgi:hypothetical protein
MRYKEQTMPETHVLTYKKAKSTMKFEPSYSLEGEITQIQEAGNTFPQSEKKKFCEGKIPKVTYDFNTEINRNI